MVFLCVLKMCWQGAMLIRPEKFFSVENTYLPETIKYRNQPQTPPGLLKVNYQLILAQFLLFSHKFVAILSY